MQGIGHGDQTALAELHKRFAAATYVIARRLVQSNETAQEVVCDVFLFVWQHARSYDARRGSVGAWLTVVTRNRAIDCWRKDGKHRCVDHRIFAGDVALEMRHPELLYSEYQEQSSVYTALAALSPVKQRVLGLAFFDGLTHDEIAKAVDLPLGTIKSHVRRGLVDMRHLLAAS